MATELSDLSRGSWSFRSFRPSPQKIDSFKFHLKVTLQPALKIGLFSWNKAASAGDWDIYTTRVQLFGKQKNKILYLLEELGLNSTAVTFSSSPARGPCWVPAPWLAKWNLTNKRIFIKCHNPHNSILSTIDSLTKGRWNPCKVIFDKDWNIPLHH